MKKLLSVFFAIISLSAIISAHIPIKTLVQIVKAEDELRFDKTLEDLMKSPDAHIRTRAALASGRIGNEAAIPALVNLLEKDKDTDVQAMAAFALGEIESIKAADAILTILKDTKINESIRARAIEAAGKIAAANPKDEKAKLLGEAILQVLIFEDTKRSGPYEKVIEYGLTAVLRARPAEAEKTIIAFTNAYTPQIRANALNTLTRLRAKNANEIARKLLQTDADAVVRANAARVLGAAEDKDAFELLLKAATTDKDSRVRVSAIRSLGSLKNVEAADKLIKYAEESYASSFGASTAVQNSFLANGEWHNEWLEIATTLGRILPNTNNGKAVKFLNDLRSWNKFTSPETEIALARIAPKVYIESLSKENFGKDWRTHSAAYQGLGEIANLESNAENNELKSKVRILFVQIIGEWIGFDAKEKTADKMNLSIPDLLRAFAAFKSENTSGIIRPFLELEEDLYIRAAAAEILGEQPASKENLEVLKKAFDSAFIRDKDSNDAALAILDALYKLDKKEAVPSLFIALNSNDYLVRKKAFDYLKTDQSEFAQTVIKKALTKKQNQVLPYSYGSKLGQILNTNADYTRAVSRKNGTVKAIFETEKGSFTINLMPEDAPLTVDNFIKLAQKNYFNGLEVHRVVPNFVMQDGDPRGDGNGGPGWSIRCEINMLEFERGAVGMALSGKDTGGSQWFVTHSPQPHLDGGYTVFGRVNETDMKVVDAIVRGDKIIRVKIKNQ